MITVQAETVAELKVLLKDLCGPETKTCSPTGCAKKKAAEPKVEKKTAKPKVEKKTAEPNAPTKEEVGYAAQEFLSNFIAKGKKSVDINANRSVVKDFLTENQAKRVTALDAAGRVAFMELVKNVE